MANLKKRNRIIDVAGTAVDMDALTEYKAMPSLASIRNPFSQHLSQGLTPQLAASYLQEAEWGFPWNLMDVYEDMEEKYPHYASCLMTDKLAALGLEASIDFDEKDKLQAEYAEFVRPQLINDEMNDVKMDLLDGRAKGYAVIEVIWDTDGPGNTWQPKEYKRIDPRYFAIDPNNGETLLLRDNTGYYPLPPYKYLIHKPKIKSGIVVRGGFGRIAIWPYLFQNYGMKWYLQFTEVCGMPVRVAKFDDTATQADKDALKAAIAGIGSDNAAIVPKWAEFEFMEPAGKSGSSDAYENFLNRMDDQVSKAILGQTDSTGQRKGSGGLGSGVDKGENLRNDRLEANARELSIPFNRQLIPWMINLNFPGIKSKFPKYKMAIESPQDLSKVGQFLDIVVKAGGRVDEKWALGLMGAPDPVAGNRFLSIAAPAPAAPMLPPDDGGKPGKPIAPPVAAPAVTEGDKPKAPIIPVTSPVKAPPPSEDEYEEPEADDIVEIPGPPPMAPFGEIVPANPNLAFNVKTAKVENTKAMVLKVRAAMERYRSPGYQAKLAKRISKAADESQDIVAILAAEIRKAAKS